MHIQNSGAASKLSEVSDLDQCINFIENIRSSCIHLHGFQLFFLLPKVKEIISFNFIRNVNFVCLRADSDRLAIVAKGFLKVQNFLASCKFWIITCRVLNKGGSDLPTLFNGPEMSFAFKANLFNEIYFESRNIKKESPAKLRKLMKIAQ